MTASRVRPVSRKPFTAEIQQRRDLRVSNEQILHEIKSLESRLEKLAVGNVEVEGATPGTLLDQVERTKKEIATLITQNTKDDRLATAARELQVPNPTLFGYPFTLNLIERTKAQRKARFPVVVVTPDVDPVEFFYTQRQRLNELQAPPSVEALPDLRAQDDEAVYEDIRAVEVPHDV